MTARKLPGSRFRTGSSHKDRVATPGTLRWPLAYKFVVDEDADQFVGGSWSWSWSARAVGIQALWPLDRLPFADTWAWEWSRCSGPLFGVLRPALGILDSVVGLGKADALVAVVRTFRAGFWEET